MMLFKFIVIFCFFSLKSYTQSLILPNEYLPGPHLIYHCERMHWACVGEEEFKLCQKRSGFLDDQFTRHCMPLETFSGQLECEENQLRMVSHHVSTRFCLKEKHSLKFQSP